MNTNYVLPPYLKHSHIDNNCHIINSIIWFGSHHI